MFSYTYETRYGDYRNFEEIKKSAILDIVQDVAIKHSQSLGYGLLALRDMGLAWFLQGIKVRFEKPVSILRPVTAQTAVKDMRGFISDRGCILTQDSEVVGKTVAAWFLIDTKTMKLQRIPEAMTNAYGTHNFGDPFFTYKKIAPCKDAPIVGSIKISNKDIDTNKHLNNQKGAELLMDALPYDFNFTDMNVLYKASTYLGDELEVCRKEIENGYYVHMQTKDKNICVMATFENIT